ncbi:sigma-70 family RNA polymerase sigma factor [uncultured Aquimarina sp.]|uniref:RNA polymerase sigma factor n=1 Tax=uncultured Aquimarina sp. TaxID=575652 RepID=UPI00263A3120|nr:sigma-70 family RNA polymerase sigma factor [uncultured Aquimarina sp.]
MNSTKNQQIIDGIIAGDSVILKAFYKKNLPVVKRLIQQYRGTTQDVEDLFQEALVLVYHKLRAGEIEFQTSIHSYFIGVCKNMWRNRLRKKRMLEYNEFVIDNAIDPSLSVTDRMIEEHQEDVYHKHFRRLSDSSKNVLRLFFEGKSMREIAENMEYTEGYTRKKKCMIKERLLGMVQSDPLYTELAVY